MLRRFIELLGRLDCEIVAPGILPWLNYRP